MYDAISQYQQAVVHHMHARLQHELLHGVEDGREDGRAPERRSLDRHPIVLDQVVEIVDRFILGKLEAVQVD